MDGTRPDVRHSPGLVLRRTYRAGETTRFRTITRTTTAIHASPVGLEGLVPLPTNISTRQQNTLKVRSVHANGIADVENRFDRLDLQYELPPQIPQQVKESSLKEQQGLSRQVVGQIIVTHYDRAGHLVGFEGDQAILSSLSAPLRVPFKQLLKVLLQEMGGSPRYPDSPMELDQKWKRNLRMTPAEDASWMLDCETTYTYAGLTRYGNSKAAIIDFSFSDVLHPHPAPSTAASGHVSETEVGGDGFRLQVTGHGQGRMLVALDDGSVLQNQAKVDHTVEVSLASVRGTKGASSDPITVKVAAETTFRLERTPGPTIDSGQPELAVGGAR